MVEQVIYARDIRYTPEFQYYSMPTSCVGGGSTMPEARASYHAALADVLELDKTDLPEIVEHVEIPVEVPGQEDIWLRTVLNERGSHERSRNYLLLQQVLPRLDNVTLKEFHHALTATGAPVLVLVLPDDPVSVVLDQMSLFDAVWMTFPTPEGVAWTALYRPMADGVQPAVDTELNALEVRHLTVKDFVDEFVKPNTDGVEIELHPGGARRISRPARDRQLVIS